MAVDREVSVKFERIQNTTQLNENYNGITLINQGGTTCYINGGSMVLLVGQSVGWQHNANEVNTSTIDISFDGGNGLLQVIYLFYKK
jgi:hypothetical protein